VTGPFHAVIHKPVYRLDLYLGEGPDQVFVRSFPVGLGQYNTTPTGRFRVKADSKLLNPEWVNPRTRQRYAADDPENPIGERWIGLEGIDESNALLSGYGIHGTIEPDTIGTQASMGCVRMHHEDVELIYEVLVEKVSTVTIVE
jgi:lipoprotein-anchoring transpeptidase ErfK/SrfK